MNSLTITPKQIKLLKNTISKDNSTYTLNGVHFDKKNMVSLNGRAMTRLDVKNIPEFMKGNTYKLPNVKSMESLSPHEGKWYVIEKNDVFNIEMIHTYQSIPMEKLDGAFPNYKLFLGKQEINEGWDGRVGIDPSLFPIIKGVRMEAQFSDGLSPIRCSILDYLSAIDRKYLGDFILMPFKLDGGK
jgi:hypothetical protein